MCYMSETERPVARVGVRELRQNLSVYLERVKQGETLEVTEHAERTFLREHLGRFGRALAARVLSEDAHGYLGALGRVLLTLIEAECARVGVGPGPIELVVRPDAADETPMLCGTADELIQIQRSR